MIYQNLWADTNWHFHSLSSALMSGFKTDKQKRLVAGSVVQNLYFTCILQFYNANKKYEHLENSEMNTTSSQNS